MADPHAPTNSPLDADDPRISEWIDGRLAPAEAMAVERTVQASPELASLVEDLRAIRETMRVGSRDVPQVELGDRIMAMIAASNGGRPAVSPTPGARDGGPGRGHRLPWLGLAGALAAGLLVTVVVNRPRDNGRDVALAPAADKTLEAVGRSDARREFREASEPEASVVATDALERMKVADAGGQVEEDLLGESARDLSLEKQAPRDAPAFDGLAADTSKRFRESKDESIATFANGGGRRAVPQAASGPVAPPPATVPLPGAESEALATLAERATNAAPDADAPRSRQAEKREKSDLAGVLVIAVTSPSERRALDRLVAASGLEATPDKDHLKLVGTAAALDAFLGELTQVGLVSAVPSRRIAEAGKLKGDEKRGDEQTSLILRVVERKAKEPPASQPSEAKEQP